ncbi:CrcB family protein [Streptomyces sp. CC228A]|uniref:fluoride efflux transporter FluC n=1 Tax=Streptomyces sp. CC228A TaxID=2898186 RepID=UPI001F2785DB|nr:CrcB family protein [Streptomyces sp. CC228A]
MRGTDWPVVGAVALGGGAGALARHGASVAWPTAQGGFPWATLWTNVLGCAVIGVFMVLLDAAGRPHRLVRPFFGTGVLGGFTTFSTFAVDVRVLVGEGQALRAAVYLAATPVAALLAVALAAWAAGRLLERRAPGR